MGDQTTKEDTMSQDKAKDDIYAPPEEFTRQAYIKSFEEYKKLYEESVEDPEKFWGRMAEEFVTWEKRWDRVLDWEFDTPKIEFFKGGKLNVSYNCLDRHIENGKGDRIAIIWEGDNPKEDKKITYRELHREVCKFANALKSLGVKRGDRVCIFLPMILELPISMLACARIGAIHSVVFGGFSADSLLGRISDSQSKVLITADQGMRGMKKVPLKDTADVRREDDRGEARGRPRDHEGRPRPLVAQSHGRHIGGMPLREHGRGGPSLHALHIGFDGKAQGRAPYPGRLPGVRDQLVQVHFRLQG
jgi:hypothetical protein